GSEIDISLSFSTTRRSAPAMPALLSASNAIPALIAPSPITATTRRVSPRRFAAIAIPSAAEIEMDECAVPKVSYPLSARRGKLGTVEPTQHGRVVDLIEYGVHDGQRSRSTIQSASSESRRANPPSGRSAP